MLIAFLARTTLSTAMRIVYPFLPAIARGLGIPLATASALVTLRLVAGIAAPFFGPLTDRFGRRWSMVGALLLFVVASGLLAGIGTFAAAAVAFALYGIAKALFDPAVHAYLGDTVPYEKRGRAFGIIELSWASAWLLGVPAAGFLIERFGWRAPWAVLIALGLGAAWLTLARLPRAPRTEAPGASASAASLVASVIATWRALFRRRSVIVLLVTCGLLTLAIEVPFIVYGAWLETTYGLGLSTLGLASAVVGLAELAAELGTTAFTDRLGKRRSVLLGLLGLAGSLAVLPALSGLGLMGALAGVALMLLSFEFAIVSLLPLVSELAPEARASLFSLTLMAFSLTRTLGSVAGGWLWQWERITLHAAVGALCALVAALVLGLGMRGVR